MDCAATLNSAKRKEESEQEDLIHQMETQVGTEARRRGICGMSGDVGSRARRVDLGRERSERLCRGELERAARFRHHEHARGLVASVVMLLRMLGRTGLMVTVVVIMARLAGHRLGRIVAVAWARSARVVPAAASHNVQEDGPASHDMRQTVHQGLATK